MTFMIVSKRVKTFYTNIWAFRSIYSIKLRAFCSTYSINVWALLSMYTNINVLTFVRCMDLRLNVSLAMDPNQHSDHICHTFSHSKYFDCDDDDDDRYGPLISAFLYLLIIYVPLLPTFNLELQNRCTHVDRGNVWLCPHLQCNDSVFARSASQPSANVSYLYS